MATLEKHSGVSVFKSNEAAPKRRTADLGVPGALRCAFRPAVFRNTDDGVLSEMAAVLLACGSLVAERMDAMVVGSFEDEERKSSEDLLAEATGRGVRIGVSLDEEARLSEDLLRRLYTFGVFRADMLRLRVICAQQTNTKLQALDQFQGSKLHRTRRVITENCIKGFYMVRQSKMHNLFVFVYKNEAGMN